MPEMDLELTELPVAPSAPETCRPINQPTSSRSTLAFSRAVIVVVYVLPGGKPKSRPLNPKERKANDKLSIE
jgi:hypothetical protein